MIPKNYFYSLSSIKRFLAEAIDMVHASIGCYSSNPGHDFTRTRKLPFDILVYVLMQLSAKSLNSDLADIYANKEDMPSASAFVQQRQKLDYEALYRVIRLFNDRLGNRKTYKGYYLLAVDGSAVNIPCNPDDKDTYHLPDSSMKGFNQLHLNALYDIMNRNYYDVRINTFARTNEPSEAENMINDLPEKEKVIIIADRGYEKYNLIATCNETNVKFLIRVKDIHSSGIMSTMNLPDEAFDIDVSKYITRLQTNEVKAHPEKYVRLMNSSPAFKYLSPEEDFYQMQFRAVRFKITDDTYECLVTNLPRDTFPLEELKDLYHMRWEIEQSFRTLKYTIGLEHFHCKSQNLIRQEIYARILMYNFSQAIIQNTAVRESNTKHAYKINTTAAITNIRNYCRGIIDEETLTDRIRRCLVPIRKGRSYVRKVKSKSAIPFGHKPA